LRRKGRGSGGSRKRREPGTRAEKRSTIITRPKGGPLGTQNGEDPFAKRWGLSGGRVGGDFTRLRANVKQRNKETSLLKNPTSKNEQKFVRIILRTGNKWEGE